MPQSIDYRIYVSYPYYTTTTNSSELQLRLRPIATESERPSQFSKEEKAAHTVQNEWKIHPNRAHNNVHTSREYDNKKKFNMMCYNKKRTTFIVSLCSLSIYVLLAVR